jgi:hypothetical protein
MIGDLIIRRGNTNAAASSSGITSTTGDGGDDPRGEFFGQYLPNLNDPGNQLHLLEGNPKLTGFSQPPLLPSVLSGFDGMNFLDSVDGFVPPSTDVEVGPNYVVETVNSQIQIYDKATGTAQLPNTPLNQFFGQPSETAFDPVVVYDDLANRFILAAPTFSSHLLIAVSNDSNPLDGFSAQYDLDVSEGGAFSADATRIGWNADEAVISFNMYSNATGSFDHVQILSFAASSLFASPPPPSLTLGTDYFSFDRFNNDFAMVPAVMHGANPGDPMYFVEENTYGDGANLRVVSATSLLSNSPTFTDTVVGVDPYTEPPPAKEPGGLSLTTFDSEILNVEYRDGNFVADQNIGVAGNSDAHARWYELKVSGTPTLSQDGTISPAPGTSTFFPAISIAAGDVIGMVYNESSATENPSVYATGRGSGDPTGTMESPVLVKAGTAVYQDFTGNPGFWGAWNGIAVDPSAPGTFWGGAEYATSALSGLPANWATFISHFQIAPSVVSSTPAAGAVVTGTPPSTFSLSFNQPIDPASIVAGDFTVNGIPADSASLSGDGLTITYTFNISPVRQQGKASMNLPAGSVTGAGDDIGNDAFTANFYFTQVQLQVTGTSPTVGSILAGPTIDLILQWNKPFNPASFSPSNFFVSQGTVQSAKPLTTQSIDLTITGVTQDGTLTLTAPPGAVLDSNGVPNLAFTGTYIVQIDSQRFPTNFQGVPPAGSLIYDPSINGAINFLGDTDNYSLALAAGQTLTLVLSTDPTLQGTITVTDPGGNIDGTATAANPGQQLVLQTAPVATAGTYTISVSGAQSTQGNYTLSAVLNAVFKQITDTNNSIGSAYDLSGAFASLGTTPASDRAGVLGTIDPARDTDYYKFFLNAGQSATLASQGLNGNISLGLYDSSGNLLAIPSQASLITLPNFSGGFSGALSQLVLNGFANINGSNLDLTNGNFSEAGSAFTKNAFNVGSFQTSFEFQVQPSLTSPLADGFTFTIQGNGPTALGNGGGDLGYGGIGNSVAIKFDYYNNAGEGTDSTGLYTDGQDPFVPATDLTGTGVNISSGDVMSVSMSYDGSTLDVTITDTQTGASASQSYSVDIPSIVGGSAAYVGFTGGTGGLTSIPAILNWTYSTQQSPISGAKFESINNFVATTSGWYYAAESAGPGTNYSMVVTRNADFTLHGKNFDTAQPLDGASVVLGAVVQRQLIFTLDDQLYSAANPIWVTDPDTATFIPPSIPAPGSPLNNPFGFNLAYDGTTLYFNNGAFNGSGELDKLDPATGTVLLQTFPADVINYSGIAYLDGKIYATDIFSGSIDIFDANTLTLESTISSVGGLTGLAGDPDRDVL